MLVIDGVGTMLLLLALWLYHVIFCKLELLCNRRFPLILSLHSLLYGTLALVTVGSFHDALCTLKPTKFMLRSEVEERFKGVNDDWRWEVDLKTDEQILRVLSLGTPLPVALTLLLCIINTKNHVMRIHRSGRKLCERLMHDRSMTIIALPSVYGLMSFQSVITCWKVCTNTDEAGAHTWEKRKELLSFEYETNFMVAELYEAWALWRFAQVILSVVSGNIRTTEKAMLAQSEEVVNEDGTVTELEKNLLDTLQAVTENLNTLGQSLEKLVMQGTYAFVGTCLCQSSYYGTLLVGVKIGVLHEDVLLAAGSTGLAQNVLFGMGLVSSTAAISNIVVVEMAFHKFLTTFGPFWKFLGTKVIVSIAFIQTLLLYLPVFDHLSETKKHLVYSSLLTYECLLVAVICVFAWRPDEAWYDLDLAELGGETRTDQAGECVELVSMPRRFLGQVEDVGETAVGTSSEIASAYPPVAALTGMSPGCKGDGGNDSALASSLAGETAMASE
eukprot:TRINITY_DN6810_c0_g6_i1.p1 TRINITY_DN6810_c0_g6~~TRINITY_DN6810_c0_g6_i1.p1  ORF type:complete len:501 (+),score=79.92 TRINITY_DN6810_c0_g6_i1:128-1630(+)